MPELSQVAAFIDNNEVTGVAALSDENDYTDWLQMMKAEHDDVLLVKHAGIGWKVTPDGLRPDKPDDTTWLWDDLNGWWDRPVPRPVDGNYYFWDEETQNWKPVEPQPT